MYTNSSTALSYSDVSCYAEELINYHTKKILVTLAHVTTSSCFIDRNDSLLGNAASIKIVIQYKINHNLEKANINMITLPDIHKMSELKICFGL